MQELVLTEDRQVRRAKTIRQICCLPLHRQALLDPMDPDAGGLTGGLRVHVTRADAAHATVGAMHPDATLATAAHLAAACQYTDARASDRTHAPPTIGEQNGKAGDAAIAKVRYTALIYAGGAEDSSGGERSRGADSTAGARHAAGATAGAEVSGSEAECKRLLAFTATWALLKDAVWRGTCQLPKGALSLSQRRFLVSSPGTSWFYRAAGIAPISCLTQLYAELLLPSNGSTFAALNAEQQLEHVAFIREQKLLLDDTPYAKVCPCQNFTCAAVLILLALLVQKYKH